MYVHLLTGPMFSGKTNTMINELEKYVAVYGKERVILLRSNKDTRNYLAHNNRSFPSTQIDDFLSCRIDEYDVVAIDEIHFIPEIRDFILKHEKKNIRLILAGLNGSYKRTQFQCTSDVFPLVDEITVLNSFCSVCKDGTKALFSKLLSDDDSNSTIIIGGADKYAPVCRNHYYII